MTSETDIQTLLQDPRVQRLRDVLGGDQLYLVGGTVRDLLLGRAVKDLDMTLPLLPSDLIERLEAGGIHTVPTGLQHQTITAVPVEGQPGVEITTFRSAGMNPSGGVYAGNTIEEDLSYRDFTINAIALRVSDGQLVDPLGGKNDIDARMLCAVGEPRERFAEDPLRVLRMIRFGSVDTFLIEDSTQQAAKEFVPLLREVSIERVRDEFVKILISDRPADGFRLLHSLGILELFLPEVAAFVDFEQNEFHREDLFNHTLEVVRGTSPDLTLRLAALFHDVAKPETLSVDAGGRRHFYRHETVGAKRVYEIFERLRFSHALARDVSTLVRTHMRPWDAGDGGLRRILRDTGELYPLWRELKEADAKACKVNSAEVDQVLAAFDERIRAIKRDAEQQEVFRLAINGNDLMRIGIERGPKIGAILRALGDMVLDDPALNEREALLQQALKINKKLTV